MKSQTGNNVFAVFLFVLSFFVLPACEDEGMKVSTGEISWIQPTAAEITGRVLSVGEGIKNYGHCYSKTPVPTISDKRTIFGLAIGTGAFTSYLGGLEPAATYYVRAYMNSASYVVYGDEISFTTLSAGLPEVTTEAVTDITGTSALSGGSVVSDGGTPVIARGVCWSLSTGPEIDKNRTSDGTGTGDFSSNIEGLSSNTKYYLRAYATNGAGTSYGDEKIFITTTK